MGLAFVFWDFFFFCKFLLLLFSSRGTRSKLHKPPVGSHSHHLGILTSHPEPMFSLVFETCHVRTAWSILEATLGQKKSLLPVSFPSLFAVILDCVFHKVDLAQGHNVLFLCLQDN